MSATIGIRREDKNAWERRVPLIPRDASDLQCKQNVRVLVQPSTSRVYGDQEYRSAGVEVCEDLGPATVILAVKEIPEHLLLPEKTYVFFAHVVKGQPHNMPMLRRLMELGCSLVDYEKVTDDQKRRLIFFGRHAGYAGMIETLRCLGHRLGVLGVSTPFSQVRSAFQYRDLAEAKAHLTALGKEIARQPRARRLIFGFSGYGNVSTGAQEVFDCLNPVELAAADLTTAALADTSSRPVKVVFREQDMVERRDRNLPFSLQEYYDHPERYEGCFEKYLPHLDVLVNCVYWDARYPRLVTREWARNNYGPGCTPRLKVIGDISCDLEGSVEFTVKVTEPDDPCYVYLPQQKFVRDGVAGDGPVVMAIDNLPCEFPRESSQHFSSVLREMAGPLVNANWRLPFDLLDLPPYLKRAVIVHQGRLTADYQYIQKHLEAYSGTADASPISAEGFSANLPVTQEGNMKHVLVLGAGLVAKPLVRFLLEKGYQVTVASRTISKAEALIAHHPAGKALALDVQDEAVLAKLIKDCDLAVSLLPYTFHPVVAKHCIANKKQMVTTSYVSAAMKEQDTAAQKAGVTILNEVGVDPGIDHMSAMRIIDSVRSRGGHIVSFRSYCGGLPAPEANDNPFGYKFSWAPRGVLLAGRNNAMYLLDGHKVEIPSDRLFRDMHILSIPGQGDYEAYPNRDSISYIDVYGLHGIKTIYRGTLRNMGWCDCLYNFGKLGLLSLDEFDARAKTYADMMRKLTGASVGEDLIAATAHKLGIPKEAYPIENLEWLGMFSNRKLGADRISPLDAMGNLMYEKLAFRPGERDMLVLFHDFHAEFPDGRMERIVSQLIDYGIPHGDSSMSRTVSLPAAIAVDMILTGKISAKGVLRPVTADIYNPVLNGLAQLNIVCKERTETFELAPALA
ncbi:MAG TPA: saccharopine dehydrogenase C-terminal domain-containing protein [Verrucomicrobiae bacterium]|nr:saccharopine dehydrogenase C-terminal domain-containing protein [Verrucomicrobiae bacterium]